MALVCCGGKRFCCGPGATRQPPARRRRHQPWPSAGNTQNRQHGRTSQRSTESAHGLGLVRLEVALLARPVPRRRAAARLAVRRRVEQLLADLDAGLDRRRRRGVRAVRHAAGVALAPVLSMAGEAAPAAAAVGAGARTFGGGLVALKSSQQTLRQCDPRGLRASRQVGVGRCSARDSLVRVLVLLDHLQLARRARPGAICRQQQRQTSASSDALRQLV